MSEVVDAGPYLCIQQLRNAVKALEDGPTTRQLHAAIDNTEANMTALWNRVKRLEQEP